jgi:predicted GNAT family acetyltransferase
MITENVAVLYWIAKMSPSLGVSGALGDTRLLEALSFLATEVHTGFKPMWHGGTGEEKDAARARLAQRFAFVSERLKGAFIFGDTLSVADCYLYVMLLWADRFSVPVPQELRRLRRRIEVRPTVRAALEVEGISDLAAPAAAPALSSDVRENPALNRFERSIDDEAMALAFYRPENEKLIFTHTIVPPEFSGQGIGADLVRGTFDLLRISGRKAVLVCPFMAHFFRSHPEYSDVVEA